MVPDAVVEIVPATVVEMVPALSLLVVEIVPAKAVVHAANVKIAAQRVDFKFFMVLSW
jgi:hypothetical protein